jgi:hypothetical protein
VSLLDHILTLGGIAMLLMGALASVIVSASIRPRPNLAAAAAILICAGLLLPKMLSDEPWRLAVQITLAAVVLFVAGRAFWRLIRVGVQARYPTDTHA